MTITKLEPDPTEWWYFDTECSNQMTSHRDWFCELDENIKRKVKYADYKAVMAEGVGKVVIQRNMGINI
jgi:hypothetical protein